jgi:hypothetical protein
VSLGQERAFERFDLDLCRVDAWSFQNNDAPDNGPAIYGWEDAPTEFPSPVRDGREILSSLTGLGTLSNREPSHKWLGYFQKPPVSGVPERFVFLRAANVAQAFGLTLIFSRFIPSQATIGLALENFGNL